MKRVTVSRVIFVVLALSVASGLLSAPIALACGIAFAMCFAHPFEAGSRRWSKRLLQLSVIALGFGMNIGEVLRTGRASFAYTAIGISVVMLLGLMLGKLFGVRGKASFLVTAGTAICGGSAIAAIAPITHPDEEELAMSMGTVFTLNSVALFLFPAIGLALHMTQTQFGLWSALAIHDTSSVVGAAAKYGPQALAVGTAVKLTRALWIIPVALLTAVANKNKVRVKLPWFIVLFCVAAFANSWLPSLASVFAKVQEAGHIGLALTLFLIGTGISMQVVKQAGVRVMGQGVLLWVLAAGASLAAIRLGWIGL